MTKTMIFLATASMTAMSAPAAAQVVQDESPFTGLRGEALVGYDSVGAGSDIDDDSNEDNDQSIDGVAYGVALGYDIDLGAVVVGPEAEFMDSSADFEIEDGDPETFGFGRVSAGRDLYLGARVGINAAPDTLVYVKGGYTNAKLNVLASDGETELDQDIDLDGYRIGAGAEYALNQNSFVKLEYRYSNYSEGEFDFDGNTPDTDRFDIDTDRHQVLAGIGIRF
ncbi:MAG: outer membrane beta-barrel protein [Pontixanthobacter sp.]